MKSYPDDICVACVHVSGGHMLHYNAQPRCNLPCCDAIQFVEYLLFSNMQSLIHHDGAKQLASSVHTRSCLQILFFFFWLPTPFLLLFILILLQSIIFKQCFPTTTIAFPLLYLPCRQTRLSVHYYPTPFPLPHPTHCHFLSNSTQLSKVTVL